jgi:hypothetical protein
LKIFAVGQEVQGVVAIGQIATGVIAIGQVATGVIAIGQIARGVLVVGQLGVGAVAIGQIGVGALYGAGMLGTGLLAGGLVPVPLIGILSLRDARRGRFRLARRAETTGGWRLVIFLLVVVAVAAWAILPLGQALWGEGGVFFERR